MAFGDAINGSAKRAAMGSLGDLAQSPLARATIKYWWVALPIAYVGWRSYQKRKAAGKVEIADVIIDMAPLIGLVGTLVMLNHTYAVNERNAAPAPAAPRPLAALAPASIKDADFTTRPAPAPVAAN